ncbi:TIGR01777 family oxidoreductase [Candidatus Kapabacteria bacterium]|nr:TIGR01777 family oxidoreductase [Candidatus Kapabacteria bacterium]
MANNIFITGGTGFIGTKLSEYWRSKGYNVKALSRSNGLNRIAYPESTEDFASLINGAKAIVNLAGASIVGKRWDDEYKEELYSSRIEITKMCAEAISLCDNPPEIFISASAIGIYGDRGDEALNEESKLADGFIADLCKDWEKAAKSSESITNLFIPRIGVVLEPGFGALSKMELPFKMFVGGPVGSGKQWFSWIDIEDLILIFDFALDKKLNGVYNITSPNPVKMSDFARVYGKVLNRPSIFRVPEFILKIILGDSAQEVLRSQKVLPNSLEKAGYSHKYSDLYNSLKNKYKN